MIRPPVRFPFAEGKSVDEEEKTKTNKKGTENGEKVQKENGKLIEEALTEIGIPENAELLELSEGEDFTREKYVIQPAQVIQWKPEISEVFGVFEIYVTNRNAVTSSRPVLGRVTQGLEFLADALQSRTEIFVQDCGVVLDW